MADLKELTEAMWAIPPSDLDELEWVQVGMAYKLEGGSFDEWDAWSAQDTRLKKGYPGSQECLGKWNGFKRKDGVTGATIFKMAFEHGWHSKGNILSYDGTFYSGGTPIKPMTKPAREEEPKMLSDISVENLKPENIPDGPPETAGQDVVDYLQAVFKPGEKASYCTDGIKEEEGRWVPKSALTLPLEKIINNIKSYGMNDITWAMSDYPPEAGAYIRINPMDGEGQGNSNVTAYRNALLESDKLEQGKQLAFYKASKLPIVAVVTSGSKSVHAIVRVDADNAEQYAERVKKLYAYCKASGFVCDEQNKNPSRYSRLPSVQRGEHWQRYIPVTWDHYESWDEWENQVGEDDGLPDFVSLSDFKEVPPLAPELIHDVLRRGRKGMIMGPSKAGKTFCLIQLAIAIATGTEWLGHECEKGSVLYVNLEVAEDTFVNRVNKVYEAYHEAFPEITPAKFNELENCDLWDLRGKVVPLDRLVPKLVKRARNKHYDLIIVDPLYKILTGDENNASDMAYFTNQFDIICRELDTSIVFSHHHAKGKAGDKAAIDRASGSGVFARDPDAIIDMSELANVPKELLECSDGGIGSAYRLHYILREFKNFPEHDIIWRYPLHELADLSEYNIDSSQQRGADAIASKAAGKWAPVNAAISLAGDRLRAEKGHDWPFPVTEILETLHLYYADVITEVSETTLKKYLQQSSVGNKYFDYYSSIEGKQVSYLYRKNFEVKA